MRRGGAHDGITLIHPRRQPDINVSARSQHDWRAPNVVGTELRLGPATTAVTSSAVPDLPNALAVPRCWLEIGAKATLSRILSDLISGGPATPKVSLRVDDPIGSSQ
jgi:hypothetical protein